MYETRNNTAVFEKTGIKLVDDFFKKFSRNFTHPAQFGATLTGTPDLTNKIKAKINTTDRIFEVKNTSFKMNLAALSESESHPFLLGSVRNVSPDGYIHVMRIMGGWKVGVFRYYGDKVLFKNYIKDLQPAD